MALAVQDWDSCVGYGRCGVSAHCGESARESLHRPLRLADGPVPAYSRSAKPRRSVANMCQPMVNTSAAAME